MNEGGERMTDQTPFVDIRHAQKSFGALEVLKDINLKSIKGKSLL